MIKMIEESMGERMARVETKLETLNDGQKRIEMKMDAFIKSADKKYAGKWVEKINYTVIIAFITAVITKAVGFW